jgi:alkylated DNA repair dioxygenase AlkB
MAPSLFPDDAPEGFLYRDDFVSAAEEQMLLRHLETLAFSNFELRGVIAKRRVAFFGAAYRQGDAASAELPDFLMPLRARVAEWAQVDVDTFAMALVNEYRPGAPIGWHRDAPQYDIVAGVSLMSVCRMKFRPYVFVPPGSTKAKGTPPRRATYEQELLRRSAYLMTGAARAKYEHSIPPVESQRYSITFRTLRTKASRA